MLSTTTKGYLVRRLADAQTVPCPCGESTRLLPTADGAPCSFHITSIREAVRHYHRNTTEVYYILEGSGKMELQDDWVDLEPGTMIWIEPGTRHRVISEAGLKTIVVAIPAFHAEDEWFD